MTTLKGENVKQQNRLVYSTQALERIAEDGQHT